METGRPVTPSPSPCSLLVQYLQRIPSTAHLFPSFVSSREALSAEEEDLGNEDLAVTTIRFLQGGQGRPGEAAQIHPVPLRTQLSKTTGQTSGLLRVTPLDSL